jgi:hypothetical protein
MMGLQFKIVYRKGRKNAVADALSRVAHLMAIHVVSSVQPAWIQEVLNSYATDKTAQQLLQQLAISSPDAKGFSLHNGLMNEKVWIGNNSAMQTKLIAAFTLALWEDTLASMQLSTRSRNTLHGKASNRT